MFRTSNPALREDVFRPAQTWCDFEGSSGKAAARTGVMTLQGTINKSLFLLALCVAAAVFAWEMALSPAGVLGIKLSPIALVLGGGLTGFVLAMITVAKPAASPVTGPMYALCEGLFIGTISALYATRFAQPGHGSGLRADPSIVIEASLLTFGTFAGMLIAYTTRIIRPSQRLRSVIVSATIGVAMTYLVSMGLAIFGVRMPVIHDATPIGIAFSGVVLVIAALNLVLDFEFVETGIQNGAPKVMEWYAGFGLLVTLVWLYLEFLRLLSKIRRS